MGVIAAAYLGLAGDRALAQARSPSTRASIAPVSAKPAMPKKRPQDPGTEQAAEEELVPAPEASEEGPPDGDSVLDQALKAADAGAQPADGANGLVLADSTAPVRNGHRRPRGRAVRFRAAVIPICSASSPSPCAIGARRSSFCSNPLHPLACAGPA